MSPSRSRYQSRVLSFLSHQSMQWRDRTLRTVRQATLTVTWGVQMVLYPVYLLFQSGRLAGQQIRSAVNRLIPLLEAVKDDDFDPSVGVPPLNPDQPLQHVLDVLDTFELPIRISSTALPNPKKLKTLPTRKAPRTLSARRRGAIAQGMADSGAGGDRPQQQASAPPSNRVAVHDADNHPVYLAQTVRGFASLLATGNLVLVDTQNQILDILTPEQQAMLYQRIVYEVAGYYRDQRLRLRSQGQSLQQRWQLLAAGNFSPGTRRYGSWRFLPPPKQTTTMALPVRLFRRLMEWMQTSPVAVSADMFHESALVRLNHGSAMPSPMPDPRFQRAIAPGQGISMGQPSWRGILRAFGFAPKDAMQPPDHEPATGFPVPMNRHWFDPDHQGGLNGWLSANQLSQVRRQAETFLSMPSLPFRNRWMPNWDEPIQGSDSIMNSPVQPTASNGHQTPLRRASSSQETTHPHQPFIQSSRAPFQGGATVASSIQSAATSASEDTLLSPAHRSSAHPWPHEDGGELFSSIDPADRDGAMATTLVDTKATLVGYVKHPLEQVLEWIDLGMLWIEDLAAKAWGWVKQALK